MPIAFDNFMYRRWSKALEREKLLSLAKYKQIREELLNRREWKPWSLGGGHEH